MQPKNNISGYENELVTKRRPVIWSLPQNISAIKVPQQGEYSYPWYPPQDYVRSLEERTPQTPDIDSEWVYFIYPDHLKTLHKVGPTPPILSTMGELRIESNLNISINI